MNQHPRTEAELIELVRSSDVRAPEALHRRIEELVAERSTSRRRPSILGGAFGASGTVLARRVGATAALAAVTIAPIGIGPAAAQEAAIAPEKNPPGDIPDNQVFVQYTSPLGFGIKVPEGWSRVERPDGARFSDKYNIIDLAVSKADQPPNATTAKAREAAELTTAGRAVEIKSVKDVKLKSGPAVVIAYASNSDPNPVTNKQIRLEHDRYLFYKDGKLAVLDMAAPQGADNVDDWSMMANSFRWK